MCARSSRLLGHLLLGTAGAAIVLALASGAVTAAVFHAAATLPGQSVTTAALGLEFGSSIQHESIRLSGEQPVQRTEIALTNTSNTGRFPLAVGLSGASITGDDDATRLTSLHIYDGTCAGAPSGTALWSWTTLGGPATGPGLGDARAPAIDEGTTRTFCAELTLTDTPAEAADLSVSLSFIGWVSTFTSKEITWGTAVTVEASDAESPGDNGDATPSVGNSLAPHPDACSYSFGRNWDGTKFVGHYVLSWHYTDGDTWNLPVMPTYYQVTWVGVDGNNAHLNDVLANRSLARQSAKMNGSNKIDYGYQEDELRGNLHGTFWVVGLDADGKPLTKAAKFIFDGSGQGSCSTKRDQ